MIFPAQVSQASSQSQRNQNQNDLAGSAAAMFMLVIQQVIKIVRTGRRMRIKAQARALARSGIIQSQERRSADGGRIVGNASRYRFFSRHRPGSGSRGRIRRSSHSLGGRRRRWQHGSAAHPAVAVRVRIFIAAASAAHRTSKLPGVQPSKLPSTAYDILKVRCW